MNDNDIKLHISLKSDIDNELESVRVKFRLFKQSLQDINPLAAFKTGWESSVIRLRDSSQVMLDLGEYVPRRLNRAFSDNFFNLFRDKVENLRDVWQNFCWNIRDSFLRALSDMLAEKTTVSLSKFASIGSSIFGNFFSGGGNTVSPELLGEYFSGGAMAKGGVVTSPTIALIGEKEPEAVVPLDRLHTMQDQPHISNTYNFNIVNPLDGDHVKNMLAKESDTIIGIIQGNYYNLGSVRSMVKRQP